MVTAAKVRAKFIVQHIMQEGDNYTITLLPVYSGSPENDMFYKYTPSGEIRLEIVNADAAQAFEVGKEYYVDFTQAEIE